MSTRARSLGELRARVRDATALREWASLATLAQALATDARAGARALGAAAERRLERERRERERMQRLLSRRAALVRAGARYVAGVDEVGMGPLAGPVVAAAVVLPDRPELSGLDDSKRLSRGARERLDVAIREQAMAVGLGLATPAEVDRWNVYRAGLEAMRRAVLALGLEPDHVLVDARTIPGIASAQTAVPQGDAVDASIAAASIVAKVHRDELMRRLDADHPGYGFARHAGYGTAEHLAALRRLGPSPVHRRSFAPCRG